MAFTFKELVEQLVIHHRSLGDLKNQISHHLATQTTTLEWRIDT